MSGGALHETGRPRATRFYHPELDVLRFAAFAVVFFHHVVSMSASRFVEHGVPQWASVWLAALGRAGASGVDLFFLLSSFLITELLLRERETLGKIDVPAFYYRRLLRIWPLYFAFLSFALWIVPHWLPDEYVSRGYALSFAFFVGNWACALGGFPSSVAGLLWSVSVEEQFYAVWPWLLRLLGGRLGLLPLPMMVVALVTRLYLTNKGAVEPAIWCNTLARLDPIALGALLCLTLRKSSWAPRPRMRALLCALGVGLVLVGARFAPAFELVGGPISDRWFALTCSALVYPVISLGCGFVLASAYQVAGRVSAVLAWAPLVYLGRISYGLYVVHIFAIHAARALFGSYVIQVGFAFALTLALASASYALIERPFLRLKERRFARVPSRSGG